MMTLREEMLQHLELQLSLRQVDSTLGFGVLAALASDADSVQCPHTVSESPHPSLRFWRAGVCASKAACGVNLMQRKLKLSPSGDAEHSMCRKEDQVEKQRGTQIKEATWESWEAN